MATFSQSQKSGEPTSLANLSPFPLFCGLATKVCSASLNFLSAQSLRGLFAPLQLLRPAQSFSRLSPVHLPSVALRQPARSPSRPIRRHQDSAGVRRRHALASVPSTASCAPIKRRRLEPPTRAAFLAAQRRRRPRAPHTAACVRPEPAIARFAASAVRRAKPRLPWGSRGSAAPPQPLIVANRSPEHRHRLEPPPMLLRSVTGRPPPVPSTGECPSVFPVDFSLPPPLLPQPLVP
jgi:hypothetical protein